MVYKVIIVIGIILVRNSASPTKYEIVKKKKKKKKKRKKKKKKKKKDSLEGD